MMTLSTQIVHKPYGIQRAIFEYRPDYLRSKLHRLRYKLHSYFFVPYLTLICMISFTKRNKGLGEFPHLIPELTAILPVILPVSSFTLIKIFV